MSLNRTSMSARSEALPVRFERIRSARPRYFTRIPLMRRTMRFGHAFSNVTVHATVRRSTRGMSPTMVNGRDATCSASSSRLMPRGKSARASRTLATVRTRPMRRTTVQRVLGAGGVSAQRSLGTGAPPRPGAQPPTAGPRPARQWYLGIAVGEIASAQRKCSTGCVHRQARKSCQPTPPITKPKVRRRGRREIISPS